MHSDDVDVHPVPDLASGRSNGPRAGTDGPLGTAAARPSTPVGLTVDGCVTVVGSRQRGQQARLPVWSSVGVLPRVTGGRARRWFGVDPAHTPCARHDGGSAANSAPHASPTGHPAHTACAAASAAMSPSGNMSTDPSRQAACVSHCWATDVGSDAGAGEATGATPQRGPRRQHPRAGPAAATDAHRRSNRLWSRTKPRPLRHHRHVPLPAGSADGLQPGRRHRPTSDHADPARAGPRHGTPRDVAEARAGRPVKRPPAAASPAVTPRTWPPVRRDTPPAGRATAHPQRQVTVSQSA